MDTRHLVDPELLGLVDSFPAMELSNDTLPAMRAAIPAMLAQRPLTDLPVTCSEAQVPSLTGDPAIRCLMVRPRVMPANAPAILHFHGGGHVLGVPEMNQPQLMRWAHDLGCLVLSIDYRLSPEVPFPGPMDDAWAALAWLHGNARDLGIDPARIAVSGESAGGAMAAGLCLMARDRGEYAIAFAHLEAPRLEDRLPAPEDDNPFTGEFVWKRANSAYCRAAYLASGASSPYASAALAADLAGLPPTFIAVGSLDLFVDECLVYARRLMRAGVAVELIVYPGCFHGFKMAATSRVAMRAEDDNIAALRRALVRT